MGEKEYFIEYHKKINKVFQKDVKLLLVDCVRKSRKVSENPICSKCLKKLCFTCTVFRLVI